mgnify:CR=1 FL=1
MQGRREASRADFKHTEFTGQCDGMTHFVEGFTVGAFTLQKIQNMSGSAGLGVVGASANRSANSLNAQGNIDRCFSESAGSGACAAILQISLVPIVGAAAATSPPATAKPVAPAMPKPRPVPKTPALFTTMPLPPG